MEEVLVRRRRGGEPPGKRSPSEPRSGIWSESWPRPSSRWWRPGVRSRSCGTRRERWPTTSGRPRATGSARPSPRCGPPAPGSLPGGSRPFQGGAPRSCRGLEGETTGRTRDRQRPPIRGRGHREDPDKRSGPPRRLR
ncbi:hypothetical protein EYF80_049833 [Liparis tanakae]|uniref:Uncharacterized protein n=1 Tax=Liparis tanakae TaxID=230148 RepID=A0A4Z2FGW7_9TELE|nr:hypothetical protein EYF80_049833 [Liparis tanakae]